MTVRVDVHLAATTSTTRWPNDVRRGLTATPKDLPPKWFYDDRGSQLFDEITRLDEYYPTRAERSDPRRARRRDRGGRAAPTRSSSSARGPRRRPGSCSTRWRGPGSCGASCRST